MPGMQSLLQPTVQFENAPSDAFRTTSRMHAVRAILRQLFGFEEPRTETLPTAEGSWGGRANHVHLSGLDDNEEGSEENFGILDRGHNETLKSVLLIIVIVVAKDSLSCIYLFCLFFFFCLL